MPQSSPQFLLPYLLIFMQAMIFPPLMDSGCQVRKEHVSCTGHDRPEAQDLISPETSNATGHCSLSLSRVAIYVKWAFLFTESWGSEVADMETDSLMPSRFHVAPCGLPSALLVAVPRVVLLGGVF